MAHFVLIHGACHGGWCWERVVPLLEAAGHRVQAPDLPGHGKDTAPMCALSLAEYGTAVGALVAAAREPVVLVGHSMAGAVISRVAERMPDAIRRLVYLTAYLPKSGESLASLARRDREARTASERVEIDGTACFQITPEAARDAFYQDADPETVEFALQRIGPEPVSVFRETAEFTEARYGRVPRAYIHCTEDRAIGYTLQREMVRDTPCDPVATLTCGHSPFLTAPKALAEALLPLGE
jgi:pimeloyl-ACP methyl ester carboxylesterase